MICNRYYNNVVGITLEYTLCSSDFVSKTCSALRALFTTGYRIVCCLQFSRHLKKYSQYVEFLVLPYSKNPHPILHVGQVIGNSLFG